MQMQVDQALHKIHECISDNLSKRQEDTQQAFSKHFTMLSEDIDQAQLKLGKEISNEIGSIELQATELLKKLKSTDKSFQQHFQLLKTRVDEHFQELEGGKKEFQEWQGEFNKQWSAMCARHEKQAEHLLAEYEKARQEFHVLAQSSEKACSDLDKMKRSFAALLSW